jgi:acetate kinase
MNILTFNCGSASQGFKVYRVEQERAPSLIIEGKARNVATKTQAGGFVDWDFEGASEHREFDLSTHSIGAEAVISILQEKAVAVDIIGHRFVHGGAEFTSTALIDTATLPALRKTVSLAPVHNPTSLAVIDVCLQRYPDIPESAVFDTMFHSGMPEAAYTYALPVSLCERFSFRKFGFYGLSS